ncbi:MBOAT family O-acyltransferase [Megalodesulfovibrio gigas]|uniref:Putative poly(Beta-D-mannuronate) O-acetyltransferase n=1 Tax=Megalodesulfovibrio gigas (strain ATCC 19364 / DSM 1382 / NCIMB 9332 / VKM B-1759) TaxID=1121448 RepID=T2G7Y9_MEGG1|nr:MBOAT family protein [Megalodesulfovibrio gigas]AGW12251.1 putative poly(beta-D-mannuronate) O-acetyltransferase [Megalodesulfovibrio gigas DSM 1382 = ATCC 19364]
MVFSSPLFLFLFLPLVLLGTLLLPRQARNGFLLVASLGFYAWGEPYHYWLMVVSILLNWAAGLYLAPAGTCPRGSDDASRKWLLGLTLAANLGLLLHYKYFNFLLANANELAGALGYAPLLIQEEAVHLPIGISFFTFQGMSYLLDVYRGHSAPQRNPFRVGLYISLFPQLIAGPIVRYEDVAREMEHRQVSLDGWAYGIQRFILGLGKKVLLANTLGALADQVMALPIAEMSPGIAWLGIICYTLQIYFDFSGYSDMAIGLGAMFGFKFPENFDYPYISQSIQEFWRRWHITLSTWFRDYLYIPLGGNRRGPFRTYFNLFAVFTLCGIWHGASWNFLIWGLYYSVFLILERAFLGALLKRIWRPIRHLYALVVVMVGWVFFRIEELPQALRYLQAMVGGNAADQVLHTASQYLHGELIGALVLGALFATPVANVQFRRLCQLGQTRLAPQVIAFAMLTGVFLLSVLQAAVSTYNPFIYFRF